MEWFRFYSEALEDPKVQRLPGDLFKTWVNLLCLANKNADRGVLPACMDDIAFALRLDNETLKTHLHTLQGQGLIDWLSDDNCYQPHNWAGRQKASDNSTARVQKHREKSNVTDPSIYKEGETLQQRYSNALDTDTDTDTDKNREDTELTRVADEPPATKAKRKTRISPSFCLTEAMLTWAKGKGFDTILDLEKETDEFVDYWRGRGDPMLDWVATWQGRIRQRAEYVSTKTGGKNNGKPQYRTSAEKNADNLRTIVGRWQTGDIGTDHPTGANDQLAAGDRR